MSYTIVLRHLRVKPAGGRTVFDPENGQPIPEDGAEVLDCKYVRRRIADGDLIDLDAQTPNKKTGNK